MLSVSRLSTIILGIGRSRTDVSSALTGDIRTGGDKGLFEYATALMNVNETARSIAAGMELSRQEIILPHKERRALQTRAAPQDRRAGLVDPVELALQLPFCFEVRTLSDRLVSSAPE
jgi:hypothetical protein